VLHFETERFTLTTNFDMEKKLDNTTEPQHDAKLPVVRSAYYVHISGMGETCIVAENIADAMDKIEKLTDANYTFIFNKSLPCII
jgi:hypothetical protein